MHRAYLPTLDRTPGTLVELTGEEAHHAARVKRLAPGDSLDVFDARGRSAHATIESIHKAPRRDAPDPWIVRLRLGPVTLATPVRPALEVCAAPPKGERLEWMIDQLSQVGAAIWRPLVAERTVVEPREGKLARLERAAIEAAKQSGRAWALDIAPPIDFADALIGPGVILADASGPRWAPSDFGPCPPELRLLIGPEGGWTPAEIARARSSGVVIASFGSAIMRIETAAVAAAALVLHALAPCPEPPSA